MCVCVLQGHAFFDTRLRWYDVHRARPLAPLSDFTRTLKDIVGVSREKSSFFLETRCPLAAFLELRYFPCVLYKDSSTSVHSSNPVIEVILSSIYICGWVGGCEWVGVVTHIYVHIYIYLLSILYIYLASINSSLLSNHSFH